MFAWYFKLHKMKKLLFILFTFIFLTAYSQATEVFNRMDVKTYNPTLRIWQNTTNAKVGNYVVTLDSSGETLIIKETYSKQMMRFVGIKLFREETGFFVFSGYFVNEKGSKFPVSGVIYKEGVRINSGGEIILFYIKQEKTEKA